MRDWRENVVCPQRCYPNAVIPEDVQAVLPGVTSHRLLAVGEFSKQNSDAMVLELIETVAIP